MTVPGSKSITNRALIAAALADGSSELVGALLPEEGEVSAEKAKLGVAEFDLRKGLAIAIFSGVMSGWLSVKAVLPVTDADFIYGAQYYWRPWDAYYSIIKAFFFAGSITQGAIGLKAKQDVAVDGMNVNVKAKQKVRTVPAAGA